MGAVPLEEFGEMRSEVHRIDRDLSRVASESAAVNARLYGVERELHLVVQSVRWGFGLLAALIVTAAGVLLAK